MIVVLDPAFFVGRGDHCALGDDVRSMIGFLKYTKAELIAVDDYWKPLWRDLIQPLDASFPTIRRDLTELRKRGVQHKLPPLSEKLRVWGFKPMFDYAPLSLAPVWAERMSRSVLRLAPLGRQIVLFARLIVGRNIKRHEAGQSVIEESTRWRMYVQPRTPRAVPIACVNRARHIELPWTARFDARLPAEFDKARHPFCPPAERWKRGTVAVATHSSKPAFIDSRGNGWARPSIRGGKGYHWDVFLSDSALAHAAGVAQLNIVEFGAPPTEGMPGDVHHIPSGKKSVVKDSGWSCP